MTNGTPRLILSLAALILGTVSQATESLAASIRVEAEGLLSADPRRRPLVESHIVAHPSDPGHLLATAIVANPDSAHGGSIATFVTFDGGVSWTRNEAAGIGSHDPWVSLDQHNRALVVALPADGARLAAMRSTDGGRTWDGQPEILASRIDHPTIALDTSDGPFAGRVYIVGSQGVRAKDGQPVFAGHVLSSSDAGLTFPQTSTFIPSNLNNNTLNALVLSDGRLLVPVVDHHVRAAGPNGVRDRRLARRRLWLYSSDDGGATFGYPDFVTEDCGGGSGVGFPSFAADRTEERLDHLYVVCIPTPQSGTQVQRSADRGRTWSSPVRIDRSPSPERTYVRTPSIAVSDSGVVAVTWYDRRDDEEQQAQDLFFTASVDGGETFLPPIGLTGQPSDPATAENGFAGRRWSAGGDYSGLTAAADGAFHVVWSDARNGVFELRHARVVVSTQNDVSE